MSVLVSLLTGHSGPYQESPKAKARRIYSAWLHGLASVIHARMTEMT